MTQHDLPDARLKALNWLNSFDDTVASAEHKDFIRSLLTAAARG